MKLVLSTNKYPVAETMILDYIKENPSENEDGYTALILAIINSKLTYKFLHLISIFLVQQKKQ